MNGDMIRTEEVNTAIEVAVISAQRLNELNNFIKELNAPPPANEIKTNKFANDSKYLPISFIEMKLDELFLGHWETYDFDYKVVANEIVGSLILRYCLPAYLNLPAEKQVWVRRTGAGAVQIQYSAQYENGKKVKTDITDIGNKIINTMSKDFPHLKSACISNAARSIGKTFGRDLNREWEDEYNSRYFGDAETFEQKISGNTDAPVGTVNPAMATPVAMVNDKDRTELKKLCIAAGFDTDAKIKGLLNSLGFASTLQLPRNKYLLIAEALASGKIHEHLKNGDITWLS